MVRTLDPGVDDAIAAAALALLIERGFARMTIEAVAEAAGVGKPAIYRRLNDKAGLVAPRDLTSAAGTRAARSRRLPR